MAKHKHIIVPDSDNGIITLQIIEVGSEKLIKINNFHIKDSKGKEAAIYLPYSYAEELLEAFAKTILDIDYHKEHNSNTIKYLKEDGFDLNHHISQLKS